MAEPERDKPLIKSGSSGQELSYGLMENSMKTQVEVCCICGHIGFSNALIYCSECPDSAVHQYCLGIPPGSIDDTFEWLCEFCSQSMRFDNRDSSGATFTRAKQDFEEHEMDSEQYENAIVAVEEELEPLCILPPSSYYGSLEQKETSNQFGIAEVTPRAASTFASPSLKYPISLDHLYNDRKEFEAPLSSLLDSPKEIMSGLVLLASLSGEIIIHADMNVFPAMATSNFNTISGCDEMNSNKPVKKLSLYKEIPQLASNLDKPVKEYGEVAYDCVVQEIGEEIGSGQENTSGDVVQEVIVMGLPAISTGSLHCIKRKRTETLMMCDLLPPIGPECKRARSKRCKIPPAFSKEVDACKFTIAGLASIGKERNDQPVNAPKVMLSGTLQGMMSQVDTFINRNLLRDNLHVEANNQECGLLNGMVDICGNNVKEKDAQVDDRLYIQERIPLCNMSRGRDLVVCGQQSEKGSPSYSQGLG